MDQHRDLHIVELEIGWNRIEQQAHRLVVEFVGRRHIIIPVKQPLLESSEDYM